MRAQQAIRAVERLRREQAALEPPVAERIARMKADAFRILVGTLLSLRTKDEVTDLAAARLFDLAADPRSMLALEERTIARAIYPVGFYRVKARQLRGICAALLDRHRGRVPSSLEALLELPGVGRKTANLVLGLGFGRPAICVDVHVHRITNRWGWVRTRSPAETEAALANVLPRRLWIPINRILVTHGRTVCTPLSPRCSRCAVADRCARVAVGRSR